MQEFLKKITEGIKSLSLSVKNKIKSFEKFHWFVIITGGIWLIIRLIISFVNLVSWDEAAYVVLARNFDNYLQLNWQTHRAPGYPLTMFVWTRIFGFNMQSIDIMNWVIYLIGFYVFYLFIKEVEGEKIAKAAIIIGLLSPLLIYFSSISLMSESMLWLTSNASLLFYSRFLKGDKKSIYFFGFFLSITFICRYQSLWLIVIYALLPFQIGKESWNMFRKEWYHVLGGAAISIIVLIPWFVIWKIMTGSILGPFFVNLANTRAPFNFLTFDWLLWFFQTPYILLAISGLFILHFLRGLLNKRSRVYIVWAVTHYLMITFLRPTWLDLGGAYGGTFARLIFSGMPAIIIITAISWNEKKSLVINPFEKFQKWGKIINIILAFTYAGLFILVLWKAGFNKYIERPLSLLTDFTVFWIIAAIIIYFLIGVKSKPGSKREKIVGSLFILAALLLPLNIYYTYSQVSSDFLISVREGAEYINDNSDMMIITNTVIVAYYTNYDNYIYFNETYDGFIENMDLYPFEYALIHSGGLTVPEWFNSLVGSAFILVWEYEVPGYVEVYKLNETALII